MADDRSFISAIGKRQEQLKRWEESDTNKCVNHTLSKDKKVKFQDGCIFLAACSSGDRDEVKRLLERGANINTVNIDGLTALHQVYDHFWSFETLTLRVKLFTNIYTRTRFLLDGQFSCRNL